MKNLKPVDVRKEVSYEYENEYANVKVTNHDYCESCRDDFKQAETVFFAWLDGTTICRECTKAHAEVELRIYLRGDEQ